MKTIKDNILHIEKNPASRQSVPRTGGESCNEPFFGFDTPDPFLSPYTPVRTKIRLEISCGEG